MKCNDCKHLWVHSPDYTNPYPEVVCMKKEEDLYGAAEDDVSDCKDYEVNQS